MVSGQAVAASSLQFGRCAFSVSDIKRYPFNLL